jgi:predicted ATPase
LAHTSSLIGDRIFSNFYNYGEERVALTFFKSLGAKPKAIPELKILGLFNTEINYRLNFPGECKIIVGPNGDGKSTVLLIAYLVLSQQWNRLGGIEFSEVIIVGKEQEYTIRQSEIRKLSVFLETAGVVPPRATIRDQDQTQYRDAYENLDIDGLAEYYSKRLSVVSSGASGRYNDAILTLQTEFSEMAAAQRFIKSLNLPTIMYLPTYRRIEKDLKEIIPEIDSRLRRALNEDEILIRSGKHYTEIVNFGMNDIRLLLEEKLQTARDFELKRISQLAAEYISGIVSGKYKETDARSMSKRLTPEQINDNLTRLKKSEFISYDLEIVTSSIMKIKHKERVTDKDKQICFFYSKVQEAFSEVDKKIKHIELFVSTANKYLAPNKKFDLNTTSMDLKVSGSYGDIDLAVLSSGEKQIVSLFAHIFLGEVDNLIIFIDEPELSLSVIWQERLITDILQSDRTRYLAVVTHSPFIFDKVSRDAVADTSEMRIQ